MLEVMEMELTLSDRLDKAAPLNNLGNKLESRFDQLGQLRDLEEAIEVARQAIELTPNDSSDKAGRLNNLGNKLQLRFNRFGQLTDLEEAIEVAHQAVELTPDGSSNKAGRLSNLANKLELRFDRLGQLADVEQAIAVARQAVELTSDDSSDKAAFLNNLGTKLESRFDRLGQLRDIEEAIDIARQAIELTPNDSSDKAGRLNNLGNKLQLRFNRFGQLTDLEEAIEVARQTIELTPDDSFDKAGRLNNLGIKLHSRFDRLGQLADIEEAVELLKQSLAFEMVNPFHRLTAGSTLLDILKSRGLYKDACDHIMTVLSLLPLINTRALNHADQLHAVSRFAGLASDACALQLECRETDGGSVDALSALEAGRGAVIGLAMDDRVDTLDLRVQHPGLADRFTLLRDLLNRRPDTIETRVREDTSQHLRSRYQTLERFNECLADIRSRSGFQDFLQSPSMEKMMAAATNIAIVYINVSNVRSDAIILTQQEVRNVKLTRLDYKTATDFAAQRTEAFTFTNVRECGKKNRKLLRFLKWLWQTAVEPVLASLGVLGPPQPTSDIPRVCWIGTGPASKFPFHAAGDHVAARCGMATIDLVISSYAPSIRSLIYTQRKPSRPMLLPRRLLLAAMSTTPSQSPLNHVLFEAAEVERILTGVLALSRHDQPSAATISHALKSHAFFHFAGHGSSDALDAMRSCILFERMDDAQQKRVDDPLFVRQLFDLDTQNAELAFLSACATADNQIRALADEGMHLASGFLIGGFRNVVATQWPVMDEVCVEVAGAFYEALGLKEHNTSSPEVARALHIAVQQVRARRADQPILWAPYMHLGA